MAQVAQLRAEEKGEQAQRMLIILSKGTMDMVYPALMIATTAATMGKEVHMFFTFWGLKAVSKKAVGSLKVSPVGNPGMPMPNILGMIPGMTAMATRMMNGKMKKTKTPSIPEMFKMAKELGVTPCAPKSRTRYAGPRSSPSSQPVACESTTSSQVRVSSDPW